MVVPWVLDEMKGVDLNDARLNDRMAKVLSQLGAQPTASIPAACGGYAELTAAYRFFDNEKVHFNNVLEPHIKATRRRMAGQSVVILAQDTTEIELTKPQQQVVGAGPLDGGSRRGLFLHPLHAFTPNGTSLGTVQARGFGVVRTSRHRRRPSGPSDVSTRRSSRRKANAGST
jgi:hypothetical protein